MLKIGVSSRRDDNCFFVVKIKPKSLLQQQEGIKKKSREKRSLKKQ